MANLLHKYSGKAAPEKSNFAQTCNLLSQYLKGRGNLPDISLGINAKLEANKGSEVSRAAATTLNLLPKMENSAENLKQNNSMASANNMKSMDFFPQFVGFASPNPIEDSNNKSLDSRKSSRSDPATAQMTIFYAGKVIVFDDFPADKAKEIMALASKGSSNVNSNGFKSTSAMDITHSTNSGAPASEKSRERLNLRPQVNGSDLPLARRASLHRFFEKRKDRASSKAPYQINNRPVAASPRAEERNHGFELEGQSSKQLELTL